MAAERKRHYAAEKLSLQGKKIVDDGLSANETYEKICADLFKATGEKLPVSSLQRYHAKRWFPSRRVLEQTEHMHGLVREALEKSQGKKLDEVSSELLKTHLFNGMAALQKGDPLALYELVISEGWLKAEQEKLQLKKEKLEIEKTKTEAGPRIDKAALFIEFMKSLVAYLKKNNAEALRHLEPHIRGFAAEMKG